MSKKILIIHHGCVPGGAYVALLGLIDELKDQYEIEVFSIYNWDGASDLKKLGIKVIIPESKFYQQKYSLFVHSDAGYFDFVNQLLKWKGLLYFFINKYFYAFRALENQIKDVDIVYLNSTFISDWAFASKKLNKKVFIHVREPLSRYGLGYRVIKNNIRKYCDNVIAVSKDNASRVGLDKITTVVYDPVVIQNRNINCDYILDETKKYFVYVGGDARIKGFEQLVNSLEYLEDNIRIFFLGGSSVYNENPIKKNIRKIIDPYAKKHKELHVKLHASKKIIYVGLTDQVFSYYNKSRFLISPFSKPHACLPILEAFSCSLPVIVSDVKGMDEIVDSSNGFFFNNDNPKSLAQQINFAAYINEEDYILMREKSYDKYQQLRTTGDKVRDVIMKL